jgi:hypothetical protein
VNGGRSLSGKSASATYRLPSFEPGYPRPVTPDPHANAALPHSPAAERNAAPILALLRQRLPQEGAALEIASGTGQHAAAFAAALPQWTWQPTEADAALLPVIAAWTAKQPHVMAPLLLDVSAPAWPVKGTYDAIFCANLLHIAPWPVCAGLMQGAARHLAPQGVLVTYGPYVEAGVPTAPSNLAFDASLRARDPAWGLRHLDEVVRTARDAGLRLAERHAMPANNLLLVFERAGA